VAALAVYAPGIALGSLPRPPRTIQETLSAAPLASYVPGIGRPIGNAGRFVGFPAALLAVAGLVAPAPTARAARLRVLAVAVGAAGWVLSLGPTLHLPADVALPLPFRLLAAVPGLSALRAPNRFGTLVVLATALLAAVGVAGITRRSGAVVLSAVAIAGLLAEATWFRVPLRAVETGAAVPSVYRWLAEHGGGAPVLEVPVGVDAMDYGTMYAESRYAYFATYHWSPLLNGYGGYPPDSFFLVMAIARRLPDPAALQDLVNLTGVRWIVLHRRPEAAAAWTKTDALAVAARWDDATVLRVGLVPTVDLRAKIAWPSQERVTLAGTPIAPVGSDGVRGALRDLRLPARLRPGWTGEGWITVENGSDRVWPGFQAAPDGLVHVGYRWIDASGAVVDVPPRLSR